MGRVKFEIVKNSVVMKDVDDESYFSNYNDYVSNSRLSLINPEENGSIKKYIEGLKSSNSSYFGLGTAFHAKILQPDDYEISDITIPDGKDGNIISELVRRNEFGIDVIMDIVRDMATERQRDDESFITRRSLEIFKGYAKLFFLIIQERSSEKKKLYVTDSSMEKLKGCLDGFYKDKNMVSMIMPGGDAEFECMNEVTIMVDLKASYAGMETILHLKGKIDNLKINDATYMVNDIKTSFHSNGNFKDSVRRFHYRRQAAFYKFLVDSYLSGKGMKRKFNSFNFLFTSTSDFSTGIYKMTKNDFKSGQEEMIYLLELAAIAQMFEQNKGSITYYHNSYSLNCLACSYTEKFKLVSLLLFLLQQFRKKNKDFTFTQLIEKIRKDKCSSTSQSMFERLEAIVESEYSERENYPTFKMTSAKEMAAYINDILDREMPFSNKSPWILGDDLPF